MSLYCDHCDDMVTRSTFIRHQKKRQTISISTLGSRSYDTDSSSEDDRQPEDSRYKTLLTSATEMHDFDKEETQDDETLSRSSESEINMDYENLSDSSDDGSIRNEDSDTDSTDNEHEEVWDEIPENLLKDVTDTPPVPEPNPVQNTTQKINSLVFWLVYFLLLWQITCQLSDNGMSWLLRFLVAWFRVLGIEFSSDVLVKLLTIFPTSTYMMREFLKIDRDNFNKFVVCPKCPKLYSYDSCLTIRNNRQEAKRCTNTFYSRGRQKLCNAQIVTRVTLSNGKTCYYPIKYYCCNSIIDELEKLLKKETFPDSCEAWRERDVTSGLMADIYDGKLWKEFQTVKGKDFLKAPRNYGLMLNFDFFQPLKRRKDYSVGVFYLAILNLPRKERFKWENIIVLGIVPSLEKEPKNLNEFLRPAIDELNALWKGVLLRSCLSRIPLTFRAAIMCISSDVPATRKLCGFKSHAAELGCSRCLKLFPGNFGEKRDYSGFDRANWNLRNHKDHTKIANKMKNCKTIAESIRLGKKAGIAHYSVLLELEYVDIVRFATIDPMHNLFLGTAKKMFHLWVDNKILSNKQLKQIENRIGSLDVPNDIGRLPKKISSNAGCYTAEQWKNWTLIYSIYCLNGILPQDHFKCWQAFVLACQHFCKPVISMTDINIADHLIIKFCKSVESIYGKNSITPNMHLHGHLKDIIIDHGPVTGYWCFSFERYNGIMGSITSNNRSLELQIMRRFLVSRIFSDKSILPKDFQDEFSNLCHQTKEELNISEVTTSWKTSYNFQMIPNIVPFNDIDWNNFSGITLPKTYKMNHLDADDLELLRKVYIMFPFRNIQLGNLSEITHTFGSISISSVKFGSRLDHRTNRSSNILASWSSPDGNIDKTTFNLTPGRVKFYFHHSLHLEGEYHIFYFAAVDWYVADEQCDSIGNPVKVWKAKQQKSGPSCFMPIQRIHSRFASVQFKDKGEAKIVVCPIGRKVFL